MPSRKELLKFELFENYYEKSDNRPIQMPELNEALHKEILAMAAHDLSVREELIADGSLQKEGYYPRMEAVHENNTVGQATIIRQYGWPGASSEKTAQRRRG